MISFRLNTSITKMLHYKADKPEDAVAPTPIGETYLCDCFISTEWSKEKFLEHGTKMLATLWEKEHEGERGE